MSDADLPRLANKDEIELFKSFTEIVRYATTVMLGLLAVCGAIFKLGVQPQTQILFAGHPAEYIWFFASLLATVFALVVGYSVLSHSFAAILEKRTVDQRVADAEKIRNGVYSAFSILSAVSVMLWVTTISLKIIVFS